MHNIQAQDQRQTLLADLQSSQQRLAEASTSFITGAERLMVFRTIEAVASIGAGHWYTCSACDHIYVVGNCGQLSESATCPQCGNGIGGGSTSQRATAFEREMTRQ